jgi:hypothetical protein
MPLQDGVVGSEDLFHACNVSGDKKFSALQKKFASQNDDTMATSDSPSCES